MSHAATCPAEDRVVLFAEGRLSGIEAEKVREHLSHCTSCFTLISNSPKIQALTSKPTPSVCENETPTIERNQSRDAKKPIAAPSPTILPSPNILPTEIGQYRIVREIGRGGMGIVYEAIHLRLKRPVAIKIMAPDFAADPRASVRFRRETELLGELRHRNIVAATDAGENDGRPYLVMELIDGVDLGALMRDHGPLRIADAADVIYQALAGLQYLFENGRTHRDLKPSNLMLATDGSVKILDLGLARMFEDANHPPVGEELTRSNQILGTYDYMAPEQWTDSRSVDIRADLYSLGCTFFKLLTNQAPFADPDLRSPRAKQTAHMQYPAPDVRQLRPEVSPSLGEIIERMMAKDPDDRYPTPKAASEALASYVVGSDDRISYDRLMTEIHRGMASHSRDASAFEETTGPRRQTSSVDSIALDSKSPIRQRRRTATWIVGTLAVSILSATAIVWPRLPQADVAPKENPPPAKPNNAVIVKRPPVRPGVWTELLIEEPEKVIWQNDRLDHFYTFSRDLKELRTDAPFLGLLGLGATERVGYKIRLGIRQTRWTGGVGLFFGLHDDVVHETPATVFQYLELRPYRNDPRQAFLLSRGSMALARVGGPNENRMAQISGAGVAMTSLPQLDDREESLLELEVTREGIHHVLWNGRVCADLASPETNGRYSRRDYIGKFGVFNSRSSGIFSNAHLLVYDAE